MSQVYSCSWKSKVDIWFLGTRVKGGCEPTGVDAQVL